MNLNTTNTEGNNSLSQHPQDTSRRIFLKVGLASVITDLTACGGGSGTDAAAPVNPGVPTTPNAPTIGLQPSYNGGTEVNVENADTLSTLITLSEQVPVGEFVITTSNPLVMAYIQDKGNKTYLLTVKPVGSVKGPITITLNVRGTKSETVANVDSTLSVSDLPVNYTRNIGSKAVVITTADLTKLLGGKNVVSITTEGEVIYQQGSTTNTLGKVSKDAEGVWTITPDTYAYGNAYVKFVLTGLPVDTEMPDSGIKKTVTLNLNSIQPKPAGVSATPYQGASLMTGESVAVLQATTLIGSQIYGTLSYSITGGADAERFALRDSVIVNKVSTNVYGPVNILKIALRDSSGEIVWEGEVRFTLEGVVDTGPVEPPCTNPSGCQA